MRIPNRGLGGFAKELIDRCTISRTKRIERGQMFRNIFLSGDPQGDAATYPKTYAYIDNLSSYLYSPVELRFIIEHYGQANPTERAKARAAASDMHRRFRQCNLDTDIEEGVTWSLVKGKTFIKLLWSEHGFEPWLIQPEFMGVLDESRGSLDKQEAFVHTSYISKGQFEDLVIRRPDRDDLLKKAKKYINPGKGAEEIQGSDALKQIVLGGLYPYVTSGSGTSPKAKGVVDWLSGPNPEISPEVLANLLRIDELWVWDSSQDDWTTIQMVGGGEDLILEGKLQKKNIFADAVGTDLKLEHKDNPLNGHHPFNEICANPMNGYMWGRSEITNVALLQEALNRRLTGINQLLRMQEKPPRFISGSSSINQNAYAKLNKAGGYLTDPNPQAKVQDLAPTLPEGLFESLSEILKMYDDMAGFTPMLQGRGETGIRSQGHAETATKNASPRFKDRALLIERQIEAIAGLGFDMLKAHVPQKLEAWVKPSDESIETQLEEPNEFEQAPAPSMRKVSFTYANLGKECAVRVDSHSSSPAFSHEARQLLFDLLRVGAATPEALVEHTHPPGEDNILTDLERAAIEKAQFMQAHPEAALKMIEGGKSKKK